METPKGTVIQLSVAELFEKHCAIQNRDSQKKPWWCCSEFHPRFEEIQKAVDEGRFQAECNDENPHLGDRMWHIERIAYLVKNWKDHYPIEMKKCLLDMEIYNGAHRMLAARHLGKTTISAYEGQHSVSRP